MRPEVERFLLGEVRERIADDATRLIREQLRAAPDPVPTDDPLLTLVEAARRRLPPESWCALVEQEAAALGMEIAWKVLEDRWRRCWAEVTTARGKTIVAPKPFQTWQAAFAEIGIEPGEAPE